MSKLYEFFVLRKYELLESINYQLRKGVENFFFSSILLISFALLMFIINIPDNH